jgi:hypothetical protein
MGVWIRAGIRGAALAAAVAVLGCGGGGGGDSGPKTYPVTGKVVVKNGDVNKLRGGLVRFESVADPARKGVGEVEDDGAFVIGSSYNEKPVPGLPEGEYRARIDPKDERGGEGGPRPVVLPKYRDFATSGLTFTVKPGSNVFTIEVELTK